jgi:hypothetical protein
VAGYFVWRCKGAVGGRRKIAGRPRCGDVRGIARYALARSRHRAGCAGVEVGQRGLSSTICEILCAGRQAGG